MTPTAIIVASVCLSIVSMVCIVLLLRDQGEKGDGPPVILSKREAFAVGLMSKHVTARFLAYKEGHQWRGLVGYEQYKKEVDLINKKLNLILDHLNLTYVPAKEVKEGAKLEEKASPLTCMAIDTSTAQDACDSMAVDFARAEKPKKKRKTTKRKKK